MSKTLAQAEMNTRSAEVLMIRSTGVLQRAVSLKEYWEARKNTDNPVRKGAAAIG